METSYQRFLVCDKMENTQVDTALVAWIRDYLTQTSLYVYRTVHLNV